LNVSVFTDITSKDVNAAGMVAKAIIFEQAAVRDTPPRQILVF
jgi:hypothetical protein